MEYTVSEFGEVIIRKRSRKERGILSNMIKVTYQERLRNKLNCYLTEKALQAEATVNLISQASYSRNNILFRHEWKVLNKENLNNGGYEGAIYRAFWAGFYQDFSFYNA